jgi:hypothetical protein
LFFRCIVTPRELSVQRTRVVIHRQCKQRCQKRAPRFPRVCTAPVLSEPTAEQLLIRHRLQDRRCHLFPSLCVRDRFPQRYATGVIRRLCFAQRDARFNYLGWNFWRLAWQRHAAAVA